MATSSTTMNSPQPIQENLTCSLTGRTLTNEEAYWAPPLITVRQLLSTLSQTILRTPGELGRVLMEEQANVPYAPEARETLASRRSAEQAKLMGLLLALLALICVPILLITLL